MSSGIPDFAPGDLDRLPDYSKVLRFDKESTMRKRCSLLRNHRDKWAIFASGQTTTALANDINTGRTAAFKGKRYEARSLPVDGTPYFTIYARYIGQDA